MANTEAGDTAAAEQTPSLVMVAIDGSEQSDKALDCEYFAATTGGCTPVINWV